MSSGLTNSAVSIMVTHVAEFGTVNVESGGFLLAALGADVAVVALTGSARAGIVRRSNQFIISGVAVEALCEWADDNGLRIVAQFHSHRHEAFLSPIDQVGGMRVQGFTSIVIPRFADPESDVASWGWWNFDAGEWRACPAFDKVVGDVRIVTFDEEGVNDES
jgi:hypothetical protein